MKKLLILISAVCMMSACTKDGATGPAGPQGATGNANVQAFQYQIPVGFWQWNGTNFYYQETNTFISSNATGIDIYAGIFSTGPWEGMPTANVYANGDQLNYEWNAAGNILTFLYTGSSTAPSQTLYFNVVIIPQAIQVKHPEVNFMDAKQVAKLAEVQAALKS